MSTGTTGVPQPAAGGNVNAGDTTANLTTEEKILLAVQESEQVIAIFKPAWAALIDEGVTLEPVVSGFARIIAGLFKHHTGVTKG